MVYTIFADYIFPCKWLSVRLQQKLLCVLEILFLGTFDKKKKKLYMTLVETSCHNLILN